MEVAGFIFLIVVLAVIARLAAGGLDSGRVEEYIRQRGGKLISSDWEPFGRGWFGTKGERIYKVRYLDADGEERVATCKTSMWAGVYFTEDEAVHSVPARQTLARQSPQVAAAIHPAAFLIHGLDHVQLAMPHGEEGAARRFYARVLGLTEIPKPANLAARGGVWFAGGSLKLHLGVEADFHPARKAHPALLVENLDALTAHLEREGIKVVTDEPLEGCRRIYVSDPFGNRLELLEPTADNLCESIR